MIHILFDSSAAGTLRQVLFDRGVRQKVVDLTDTLDLGPISSGNFEDREAWFEHHIPGSIGDWDWIAEHVAEFRRKLAADADRLIWIAPRSAAEQSGLYWFLAEFGAADARVIVADYPLRDAWRGEPPHSLGGLQPAAIGELLDGCPRVALDKTRFPADRWRALMAEDARVRVVEDGVLNSAPDDYFDQFFLSRCTNEWTKWTRALADATIHTWKFGHSPGHALLHWRLRELVEREEVACDGDLPLYYAGPTGEARVRRVTTHGSGFPSLRRD